MSEKFEIDKIDYALLSATFGSCIEVIAKNSNLPFEVVFETFHVRATQEIERNPELVDHLVDTYLKYKGQDVSGVIVSSV